MHRSLVPLGLCAAVLTGVLAAQEAPAQRRAFPVLQGPYLGQRAPGMVPELFAPGIVSTGMDELNAVFSRDGAEFFFAVKLPVRGRHVLLSMTQAGGRWSAPAVVPFSGQFNDADPALSPDGRTLFFASSRPITADGREGDWNIWAAPRTTGGWGPPVVLGAPVNSDAMEVYPSLTADGTLYFSSSRPTGSSAGGIYRSVSEGGRYLRVGAFDDRIVSEYGGGDVCIFPDERTIVFSSSRPGGYGGSDLYVSFRHGDARWTEPRNLGPAFNSPQQEYCPSLSPDGKYFFFSSYRRPPDASVPGMRSLADILKQYDQPYNGNGDVYWVEASVIEAMRRN